MLCFGKRVSSESDSFPTTHFAEFNADSVPTLADGCDPISFKVAIHSIESDTPQTSKAATKSSYGISHAQLLESEDDSDVIVIEAGVSEHDDEAHAEREHAAEMARQATQAQISDYLVQSTPARDSRDHSSSSPRHESHSSEIDQDSSMERGHASSEFGDDSMAQHVVVVEDNSGDEHEEEEDLAKEEEDDLDGEISDSEEELDDLEIDEEEVDEEEVEEEKVEEENDEEENDDEEDFDSLPPPPVSLFTPSTRITADFYQSTSNDIRLAVARYASMSGQLGFKIDSQTGSLCESPLPSPPQTDESESGQEYHLEDEEVESEVEHVEGECTVAAPASQVAVVSEIEEDVDHQDSQESVEHDDAASYDPCPFPPFLEFASQRDAFFAECNGDVKKRGREDEEEPSRSKVLPYNASFEFTDSPSERSTLLDAPVKMDASTSTHSHTVTSTHTTSLDSTADKILTLPSDAYPSPPKRRRINYKQIVMSSTVGFVAGAAFVFAGLGALGEA